MKYITEQDVVSLVTMDEVVASLREILVKQSQGEAFNVPKALGVWGNGSSMHSLGSCVKEGGYAGFKNWLKTPTGGGSLYNLFDSESGKLLAIIEARALGMLRTAAITGLASQYLAPKHSSTMALIGTGIQAITQLLAIDSVMDLKEVKVFSPTEENRVSFVQRLGGKFKAKLQVANSLAEATDGAEIVTTITRASEPFLSAQHLNNVSLLNAVGAILPSKAEFEQSVFSMADLVVVDDIENARKGSKELREFYGVEAASWEGVSLLGDLINNNYEKQSEKLTIFKGMGMGLSDLAVATLVYQKALIDNIGVEMPDQTRENLLLKQITK